MLPPLRSPCQSAVGLLLLAGAFPALSATGSGPWPPPEVPPGSLRAYPPRPCSPEGRCLCQVHPALAFIGLVDHVVQLVDFHLFFSGSRRWSILKFPPFSPAVRFQSKDIPSSADLSPLEFRNSLHTVAARNSGPAPVSIGDGFIPRPPIGHHATDTFPFPNPYAIPYHIL